MRKSIYSINYQNKLDVLETQKAIKFIKERFEIYLAKKLSLLRVSAPLFVKNGSGLNDGLSGVEKPISFEVKNIDDTVEIVHSLAKWKRQALGKYNFALHTGLYTDMNAIRKDETLDFMHSIYVDQWDWEVVISNEDRKLSYLRKIVRKIYSSLYKVSLDIEKKYPELKNQLAKDIVFISTKELEKRYPELSRKEREDAICREYKSVFLYQIGNKLKDKMPHDSRAADYDDWNLNGDILVYNPLYDMAFELSSMGIRVNKDRLLKQLKAANELSKVDNPYCQAIINDKIPLTIGGGIGQSRLSMFLLQKAHIGEVQVSIWDEKEINSLKEKGIFLL